VGGDPRGRHRHARHRVPPACRERLLDRPPARVERAGALDDRRRRADRADDDGALAGADRPLGTRRGADREVPGAAGHAGGRARAEAPVLELARRVNRKEVFMRARGRRGLIASAVVGVALSGAVLVTAGWTSKGTAGTYIIGWAEAKTGYLSFVDK